jgi:ABC-type branched-subunit amino acid transport system ATPase component/branched-subunit amino acid ABC-type transport system permease component
MSDILPFVIAGITTGAIYGLAGSGLVITYKTSGIFNFAHGAIAAAAAYLFYWLTATDGMNWVIAFVICVPVLSVILGLLLEIGTRSLARKPIAMQIVGTVGIVLLVEALSTIKFGPDALTLQQYLPGGNGTFRFLGVNITWAQLTVIIVALILTLGLYVFLRLTKTGLAMRAVVDNSDLVGLHGTSPVKVRRTAWIIGSVLASASGVLLAPLVGIQAIVLTYLVIAAIGAAAVGGFSSIPLTYVGGIIIGVISSLSEKFVLNVQSLAGLPQSVPFIVLLVAMLVIPKRRLIVRNTPERSVAVRQQAPPRLTFSLAGVAAVVLLVVPTFAGTSISFYMQGLTLGIMLLSLGLLVRTAGQVSLCQSVFGAIGAVTFSQLMLNAKLPWLAALFLGCLILVPIAALVALFAMRLSGLLLALATLSFAIIVERFAYPLSFMFGSTGSGRLIPRPSFASSDKKYYYVVLAFFALTMVAMFLINRGRLGRMLKGLSDSPTVLSTMGLSINMTKLIVFCLSAFFAGLSGILYGGTVTYATFADSNYSSFESLLLLAIVVVVPLGLPWFALFAIPIAIIPGYIHGANVSNWLTVLFGVSAIVVALQGGQPPLPRQIVALYRRFTPSRPPVKADVSIDDLDRNRTTSAGELAPGLDVRELTVRFGGLVAVDDLSFEAPIGRVTGLIGPNGAGKTTTFNACSGVVRPSTGNVLLHGDAVSGDSAPSRARKGLGRTFQITELCENLTVRENVAMGREAGIAGSGMLSQMVASRSARRAVSGAANEAIELCGIQHLAEVQAGALTTGERRLVEVARCLAGDFDVLLLDEPSAGLDRHESERLSQVLRIVMQRRRCGVLLVEHDMAFVMGLCDYIYVLDFGRLLFEGSPRSVASSSVVQAAYLGSSAEEVVAAAGEAAAPTPTGVL